MVLTLRQHPAPPTDRLRDSHPLRSPVPVAFGSAWAPRRAVGTPLPASRSTPEQQRAPARYAARVWAPPVSLAATPGILSSPQGTEMFQFPQCPPPSSEGGPADWPRGVAPFGYPWITRCQLVPRAFRGVATSFLGSRRLGIPHALIFVDLPQLAPPAPRSRPGPHRPEPPRGRSQAPHTPIPHPPARPAITPAAGTGVPSSTAPMRGCLVVH